MPSPSDLLHALSRAQALAQSHRSGDPALVEALEDVRQLQGILGWIVVRVQTEGFWAGGQLLADPFGELDRLRGALEDSGIQEIRFQDPMEPGVVEEFLRRLQGPLAAGSEPVASRFRGLEGELGLSFSGYRGPLPGMAGSIQELFGAGAAPASGPGPAPSDPIRAFPDRDEEPSPWVLPPELERTVARFLESGGARRGAARKELDRQVPRLRETRDIASLATLVERLVEGGREDAEALEFARELSTPAVASQLVARLGAARQERERARLVDIASGLGLGMAQALADAIGEARDRFQRRAYMDAMKALGPVGVDVVAPMVEDPRWYVVRNGVALLGELGGEEAVYQVTGALANTDPRVRREAVLALARLGGVDAAQLLVGMLADPDPDVRAMSCRALGALKVEKALKPLLRLLEADDDQDVQVECLQALGQIGDPGAVPPIERRAVGGLLSRPAREIRVAAYRALAAIGTPHARELVKKASRDSDHGVRAVARTLLEERRS
jgi:HEAT repeat protein